LATRGLAFSIAASCNRDDAWRVIGRLCFAERNRRWQFLDDGPRAILGSPDDQFFN
jgi:hypothetical protein